MASDSDSSEVIQKAEPNPSETHAENNLPNPAAANAPGNNYCKIEDSGDAVDSSRRLWIGNLSPKLTDAGLPRGYAFITYQTAEDAKKCLDGLDGKRVLDRTISVRYAHQTPQAFMDEEEKLRKKLPALGMKPEAKPVSKERAISAIEAKLRAMEREKDEVSDFCLTAVGSSTKNGSSMKSRSAVRSFPYASKSSSQFDARNRSRPYVRRGAKKRF